MKQSNRLKCLTFLMLVAAISAACDGINKERDESFVLGGTVRGLGADKTLVLQGKDDETIVVKNADTFAFKTRLIKGASYRVLVMTQPQGQSCEVNNGEGTVTATAIKDVDIQCADLTTYTVGGDLIGLKAGGRVTIQNNDGDDRVLTTDGPFVFESTASDGQPYSVSVALQPHGQTCVVDDGSGTIDGNHVENVRIECLNSGDGPFRLGGNLSGLTAGHSVSLRNNGGPALVVSQNGKFEFGQALNDGETYNVTTESPGGPTCTVTDGSGTIAQADVANVMVECQDATPPSYVVGGNVFGLETGRSISLSNNGGPYLLITDNGAFAFPTELPAGQAFEVTMAIAPIGQTCSVANGAGITANTSINAVVVTCTGLVGYSVAGILEGLGAGKQVVVKDNQGTTLTLVQNGPLVFPAGLADGSPYEVTVVAQPVGQSCTVVNGLGNIAGDHVDNVEVSCTSISGLAADALSDCASLPRDQAPFNSPLSTFTNLVRDTVKAPQPVVNGASLAMPNVATQKLIRCGYIDPTQAPYNADPTGVKDSTAAINDALDFARRNFLAVYLPSGKYKVHDTIECYERGYKRDNGARMADRMGACVLTGSHLGARPQLILTDGAAGFGNASKPKAMVYFWGIGDIDTIRPGGTYNQTVENVHFVVGNNAGAIGLRIDGAQGTVIHDVSVNATGGFAGVWGNAGAGTSDVNISVTGGRYGIYAENSADFRSATRAFVSVTLLDQTVSAIVIGNMLAESTSIVGAKIRMAANATGPAIQVIGESANTGLVSLIDAQIDFASAKLTNVAVSSNRSIQLNNVFVKGAGFALKGSEPTLEASTNTWSWVQEFTRSVTPPPKNLNGTIVAVTMPIYLNGAKSAQSTLKTMGPAGTSPPADLVQRHGWNSSFPVADSIGAVNVKRPPYNAAGNGTTDDTAALQAAIDAKEIIFLPKGYYLITKTLKLKANTKLIGVAGHLSVIINKNAGDFTNSLEPKPMVATVDSGSAATVLSNLGVYASMSVPGAYAIDWRAGDRSVVRNAEVRPFRIGGFLKGGSINRPVPLIQLSGNAGGRFYSLQDQTSVGSVGSNDYRFVRVRGTTRPIRFYNINPEHMDGGSAYISIENAKNVAIFSLKAESRYQTSPSFALHPAPPIVWIKNSAQVNLFGTGGLMRPPDDNGAAFPPSLFRVTNSTDFRFVTLMDRLGYPSHSNTIITIAEQLADGTATHSQLKERPTIYARNPSPWHELAYPRSEL